MVLVISLEVFVSADGVVCRRRGQVEVIVGIDERKKELEVMVGLKEFSEKTESRVLLCNKSNCSSNCKSEGTVVEVKAEELECIGDKECESSSVCEDDWIGVVSSNWM